MIWIELLKEVRSSSFLLLAFLQAGTIESFNGSKLVAVFPTTEKLALESLQRANHRATIEGILQKQIGHPVEFLATIKENLVVIPTELPPEEIIEEVVIDPMEDLKNDPLIQRALDIFKATELSQY